MKLLVLGGSSFLGRHCVASALSNGHEVTLFNRNKTNSGIFPEVERLIGDRDGKLDALLGRTWDAVIDVNGYLPRIVRDSSKLLQENVDHYLYISSGSVYDLSAPIQSIDEKSPLVATEDINTEIFLGPAYGGLKLLCEKVVTEYFPDRSTILRPGLIAGPHDNTDRITYWVDRIARGGEVLVPVKPNDPIQFIDARDIAEFAMLMIENKISGTFNTSGEILTWREWLSLCQMTSGSEIKCTWVDDSKFVQNHLGSPYRPFGTFPLLTSDIFKFNSDKASAAGMKCRPAIKTAQDILAWQGTRKMSDKECPTQNFMSLIDAGLKDLDTYWMCGITAQHEKSLLRQWHKEKGI